MDAQEKTTKPRADTEPTAAAAAAAAAASQNSKSSSNDNGSTAAESNGKPRARRPYKKPHPDYVPERASRAACDFCHNKRVKCVTLPGQPRCEQCTQRDTVCIFSLKGKTGPKPKSERKKMEAMLAKETKEKVEAKTEAKAEQGRETSTKRRKKAPPSRGASSLLPPPYGQDQPQVFCPADDKRSAQRSSSQLAAPVASGAAGAERCSTPVVSPQEMEREFLDVYINTVGQFVPLVHEDALRYALRERQRLPAALSAARGVGSIALEQAEVVGAIAIGALVRGDMQAADVYRNAVDFHLSGISSNNEPRAAPALGLMAVYWQHLGEDELKLHWLSYLRGALGTGHVSGDLVLSIQYLDYAVEARPRPGVSSLTPARRTLHTISCLLSYMPNIVNPNAGHAAAVAFCDDLGMCLRALESEAHAEVAKLLCKALRALLLVMLGRGDKAMTLLQTIPALVRESEGGNPDAMRALPLSWDALLIAGALTFLLGQLSTYRRIRASVMACVESMPWESRWSFCLPDPESDPEAYIDHLCDSSSNICTITCSIAGKTSFGQLPFYTDGHMRGHHQQQLREEDPDFAPRPSFPPAPPARGDGFDDDDERSAATAAEGSRPGAGAGVPPLAYGAGGMAMHAPTRNRSVRAGGGSGAAGYGSGGTVARADGGGGIAGKDGCDDVGGGVVSDIPHKRRRTRSAQNLAAGEAVVFGDRGWAEEGIEEVENSSDAVRVSYLEGDAMGADNGGGGGRDFAMREDSHQQHHRNTGGRFGSDHQGRSRGGGNDSFIRGGDLHSMSLSRLVAGSVGDSHNGPLGRVPSDGIMDISSTISSFDMAVGEGGGDGGRGGGERSFSTSSRPSTTATTMSGPSHYPESAGGGGYSPRSGSFRPAAGSFRHTGSCTALGGGVGGGGVVDVGIRPPSRSDRPLSFAKQRTRETDRPRVRYRSRVWADSGYGGDDDAHSADEAVVTVVTGDEEAMDGWSQHGGNVITVDALLGDAAPAAAPKGARSHGSSKGVDSSSDAPPTTAVDKGCSSEAEGGGDRTTEGADGAAGARSSWQRGDERARKSPSPSNHTESRSGVSTDDLATASCSAPSEDRASFSSSSSSSAAASRRAGALSRGGRASCTALDSLVAAGCRAQARDDSDGSCGDDGRRENNDTGRVVHEDGDNDRELEKV